MPGEHMKKQTRYDNASRVSRQKTDTVERALKPYRTKKATYSDLSKDTLRIIPLGGQDGIGEKNMIVVEYNNSAIILDCGFSLGIDIPGVNYAIPVSDYLATIKHKIKGYVISHGHLDHIGALRHILPDYPAPVYGSQFTIGMVLAQFNKDSVPLADFQPDTRVLDMDSHESVHIGEFIIELVRVTHAIPESSAIVVDTPVGRLINTGDFRLDPEPLDKMPSDIARLRQLGDEGVRLLMSESTNTTKLGRTPTEHTLQDSFYELIGRTEGRMLIAVFSTNMNRIQMIINAAHASGKKVALDGRSMIAVAELAVRLGTLKIPKGTLIHMRDVVNVPQDNVVVVCTGGQGEPGAALSRMAAGEHRVITLQPSDSVVISSTPIVGNEESYARMGDLLASIGVKQYRHPTFEIDGSGPLHVSGHASRDEHAEMIQLTKPEYLMPIYGGPLPREYHRQIGRANGIKDNHIMMVDNGGIVEITKEGTCQRVGYVVAGSRLVDQTGRVVPEIVSRDRMLLRNDGIIVVMITLDSYGKLLSSPDIITRGHIAVKNGVGYMDGMRGVLRKSISNAGPLRSRADIDTLKQTIKTLTTSYVFDSTQQTPFVIPVVTVVSRSGRPNTQVKPVADVHS